MAEATVIYQGLVDSSAQFCASAINVRTIKVKLVEDDNFTISGAGQALTASAAGAVVTLDCDPDILWTLADGTDVKGADVFEDIGGDTGPTLISLSHTTKIDYLFGGKYYLQSLSVTFSSTP